MKVCRLTSSNDLDEWRRFARAALIAHVDPDSIHWVGPGQSDSLFSTDFALSSPATENLYPNVRGVERQRSVTVPRAFAERAGDVICHRDPTRFARLYQLAWRLQTERGLLSNQADDDVRWFEDRAREIRRDIHKMHAFVRFRKIDCEENPCFVAWFEPGHLIVERTAQFFTKRFTGMRFSILTPDRSMHWDTKRLRFAEGCQREQAPSTDELEQHWKIYYAKIFNPARLKVDAMMSEMPRKYWKNLPEAQLIPDMVAGAQSRVDQMRSSHATEPTATAVALAARNRRPQSSASLIETLDLPALNREMKACANCPLSRCATQVVCGVGPGSSAMMIIGEQPGDEEDLAGVPFIGPAGKVLDDALIALQIDRDSIYLTNAVKHFKFRAQGKRRLHQRPTNEEVEHCRWWLAQEIRAVNPTTIVALGKTAALAVLRNKSTPLDRTDSVATLGEAKVFVTYHPAYLLRVPAGQKRSRATSLFTNTIGAAYQYKCNSLNRMLVTDLSRV